MVLDQVEQKEPIEYDLRVWTISGRQTNGKKQTYVLGLCSAEALTNETVKVQTKLLGKAEGIIQKLLGPEGLGSTKTLAAEESKFSMVFNGGKRRPFDIGSILAKKCVPNTATVTTTTSSGDTTPSVKGSAGYYFGRLAKVMHSILLMDCWIQKMKTDQLTNMSKGLLM